MGIRMLILSTILASGSAQALDAARLMPALTWEKRVLLVFAPDPGHAELRQQQALLDAAEDGLLERDMTVIHAFADRRVSVDGTPHAVGAPSFYDRFAVAQGEFRVILVGKDGTVKLDRGSAVDADDLFALIDAMPMRRLEMQRDG